MDRKADTVDRAIPGGRIAGQCDSRFEAVLDAFVKNFEIRGEVGAAVCLTHEGETVVDLWGGRTGEAEDATPWRRDTMCVVFSSTKGATALCAHVLMAQGKLDLEAPVAELWPEFAANGKDGATVRMMLDHSAGVPALRDKLPDGAFLDWDGMVARLQAEAPFWPPGTRHGYHGFTFGWTVGELVRRAGGRSLGGFFREAIAEPLAAEFWIGLPEELEAKVAPVIYYRPRPDDVRTRFVETLLADAKSIPALFFLNRGGIDANGRAAHAAELGAGGGIGNARGLARIYRPLALGGSYEGVSLVDSATLTRMGEVSSAGHDDATLRLPTRFSPGFMKSMDNRRRARSDSESVILGAPAFGHVGAGGSIGFCDPEAGLSFGYVMNKMGAGILLNPRGQALVDAAYRSLGYSDDAGGVWCR